MKTKERMTLVAICVTASFFGGFLATTFFQGIPEAQASEKAAVLEVVSAEQFRLMDANGKPRALLTTSKKSTAPMFILLDETGTPRHTTTLTKSGDPVMSFLSAEGKNVLAMNTKPDGTGAILMMGQDKSTAGSWTIVQTKDGNWHTAFEAGLVEATLGK